MNRNSAGKNEKPDPNSDEIWIEIPPEERWENRVEHGHTRSQWIHLCERFHQRCAYCGIHKTATPEGYLTRDHIRAVTEGGNDKIENIVPACKRCNFLKGTKAIGEYCGVGFVPQPKPRKRLLRWWLA